MVPPAAQILIVDDEPSVREFIAEALESVGYAVATAESGSAGIRACTRHPPDLVLLDIALPDIDGLTVLDEIRAAHPGLPVMMITGRGDDAVATRSLQLGAVDVLPKPFDLNYLLERVEAALAREAD